MLPSRGCRIMDVLPCPSLVPRKNGFGAHDGMKLVVEKSMLSVQGSFTFLEEQNYVRDKEAQVLETIFP